MAGHYDNTGNWVEDPVVSVAGLLDNVLGRQVTTSTDASQNTTGTTNQAQSSVGYTQQNGTQASTAYGGSNQNTTGFTGNTGNSTQNTQEFGNTATTANTNNINNLTSAVTGTANGTTTGSTTGSTTGVTSDNQASQQNQTGTSVQNTSQTGSEATSGNTQQTGSQSVAGTTTDQGTVRTTGTTTSNINGNTSGTNTSVSNADTVGLHDVLSRQLAGVTPDMLAAIFQQGYKQAGNVQAAQTNALGARGVGNSPAAQALNMMNMDLTAKAADLNRQMLSDAGGTAQAIAAATKSTTDTTNQNTTQTNVQVQDLLAATDTKNVVSQLVNTLNNTNTKANTQTGSNTSAVGSTAQNTTGSQQNVQTQAGQSQETSSQANTNATTQNTNQTDKQTGVQNGTQATSTIGYNAGTTNQTGYQQGSTSGSNFQNTNQTNAQTGYTNNNQNTTGTQTQNATSSTDQSQHTTINTNVAKSLAGMVAAGIGMDQVLKAATGQGFVGTSFELLSWLKGQGSSTGIDLSGIDPSQYDGVSGGAASWITDPSTLDGFGFADGGAMTRQGNVPRPNYADGGFLPVPDLMNKIKKPLIDPDAALMNALMGGSSSSSAGNTSAGGGGVAGGGSFGADTSMGSNSGGSLGMDFTGGSSAGGGLGTIHSDALQGIAGTGAIPYSPVAGSVLSKIVSTIAGPIAGTIAGGIYKAISGPGTPGTPYQVPQEQAPLPTDTGPINMPDIPDPQSPGPGPTQDASSQWDGGGMNSNEIGWGGNGGGSSEGRGGDGFGGGFDGYDGGGFGGAGYYEGGCVEVCSFLPDGLLAGEVRIDDWIALADEKDLKPGLGKVTFSKRKTQPGWRIVTESGASLRCSSTAPIPTPDGIVLAPELLGKKVPVMRDTVVMWEPVKSVEPIGDIAVQHISVGDRCFWAGETRAAFILHHNKADGGMVEPEDKADQQDDMGFDDDAILKSLGVHRATSPDGQLYFTSAAVQSVHKAIMGKQGSLSPGITSQDRGASGRGGSNFADGGKIVGPGTGVSDSIPAQGPQRQPIRVANGEYIIPADVVQHFGVDAFDNLLAAIHTPAAQQRRG